MTDPRLARLAELAALRAARSAARLRGPQAQVDALRRRDALLRQATQDPPTTLEEARVRDRHDAWRRQQLARLAVAIAAAEAVAQPLREAQARDRAREAVLDRLRKKS